MYRHWCLAFLVVIFAFWLPDKKDFCTNTKLPAVLVQIVIWANICPPITKVYIPFSVISWELDALHRLTSKLPDTSEMAKNRIEIGKISVALTAIGTPESRLTSEAIQEYDNFAKAMLRSLSKLGYMSKLAQNTLVSSTAGIVKALEGFPRDERRHQALLAITQSRQEAINAWARGLEDELKELHGQAVQTLDNLDLCDSQLAHVIRTSKRQQPESTSLDVIDDWGSTLFEGGRGLIRPAALEAVRKLESLIRESAIARDVVGRLTIDVAKLLVGIEAVHRDEGQVLSVELALEKEVKRAVDMLRKVGRDVNLVGPSRDSKYIPSASRTAVISTYT